MSLGRGVTPLATGILPLLRSSTPRHAPTSRICWQCRQNLLRPLASRSASSRRQIATAAAEQRPTTFDPQPPPRNPVPAGSSITADPPAFTPHAYKPVAPTDAPPAPASMPEPDAASTPSARGATGSVAADAAPSSDKPKRKSRLRPRKAAMTLTPRAVQQLRGLLEQPEPKLIRVGVKNRGCSGLAYHLEYVDEPGKFDEAVEQDGVKVLVDSKALFSIIGSEMDWIEDKLSQRFVFKNPNITEQCGCGESFSIG